MKGTEEVAGFLSVRDHVAVEDLTKVLAKRSLPTARRGYDRAATDALLDKVKTLLETLLAERNAAQARAARLADELAAVQGGEPPAEAGPEPAPEVEPPVEVAEPTVVEAPEPPPEEPEPETEPVPPAAEEAVHDEAPVEVSHSAAVLDDFAEVNEELERMAEDARARVRALAERLASGDDIAE